MTLSSLARCLAVSYVVVLFWPVGSRANNETDGWSPPGYSTFGRESFSPWKGPGESLLRHETINCTPPTIQDFPADMFTQEQRQQGALIVSMYCSDETFLIMFLLFLFFLPLKCRSRCSAFYSDYLHNADDRNRRG